VTIDAHIIAEIGRPVELRAFYNSISKWFCDAAATTRDKLKLKFKFGFQKTYGARIWNLNSDDYVLILTMLKKS